MSADSPTPVPPHLQPDQRFPLGPGDLRISPSTDELRTIAKLLEHENLAGQALVTMRDGSPWLELAIYVPHHEEIRAQLAGAACPYCGAIAATPHDEVEHMTRVHPDIVDERLLRAGLEPHRRLAPPGSYRYAIWRYTCKAYRVGADGAVEDDPLEL